MKIKLCFNAQFVGSFNEIVEVLDEATDEYIKSLFPEKMGLPFDDNCWWEEIMKKSEALGLRTALEQEISTSYCNENIKVQMSLNGKLQIRWSDDNHFINFDPKTREVVWVGYNGDWSELISFIETCQMVFKDHDKLVSRLMWSYDHKSELIDDLK
jgi:hypothetical protein